MTRKHPRVVLRRALADEAPWTRQPELLTPDDALRRVSRGDPWVVHWCGGPSASSADDSAARHLADVREHRHFVGPEEQQRLIAKAERLGVLSRRARSSGKGGRLTDVVSLTMHKSFRLSSGDVRKAPATGTRVPLREQVCNRNKTHVATGTRVPGNNKGNNTYPSHREETYQKEALGPAAVRLAVVAGTAVEGGG